MNKSKLKQIIREEIFKILKEGYQHTNDNLTLSFITGKISESTYTKSLNGSLTEGVFFDDLKEKIMGGLYVFLTQASKIGFKIISKLKSLVRWIWNKVKSFKQSNPSLYKAIVITLLIMTLLIISASAVHAQTTGQPIDVDQINIAIGFIKDMEEHGGIKNTTGLDINKAIAYLIKLRDTQGVVDSSDVQVFGSESVKIANGAIKAAESIASDARAGGEDSGVYKYCLDLMEKGSQYVTYVLDKSKSIDSSGSREFVRLGIK